MMDSHTKEEMRKVFGVVPERLYNPKVRQVRDEENVILVVLSRPPAKDKEWTDPDVSQMEFAPFLIDRVTLVAFARQVLEHLDPSPELATLQRIEELLKKSSDTS